MKTLYSPQHYFLVHVDSRQDYMHREMEKLSETLPTLRLVKKRFSTIWGGASLLPLLSSPSSDMSEYAGLFAGGFSWEARGEAGPGLFVPSPPRRFTSSSWG